LDGPQIGAQLQVEAQLQSALIFGREDHGLTKAELNYAQRFVRIPTPSTYTSLNLAQAVAICCYELAMIQARSDIEPEEFREKRLTENGGGDRVLGPRDAFLSSTSVSPAAIEILEGYYQHLESLLLQIGYLYPHTATRRMEKLRRLYHRASPSEAEVAMLRGVLSQVEWALQNAAVLNSRP
jgi:tRNA/rRNA methyltransferase